MALKRSEARWIENRHPGTSDPHPDQTHGLTSRPS